MTAGTYVDFLKALGQNESGNNYAFVSSLGYLGRFQFGEEALQAIGFYYGDNTSKIDFIGAWTPKAASFGVHDKASFLNSPSAQDAAARAWFEKIDADLDSLGLHQYEGKVIGGVTITESGLLAGAHLVGVWALKSFLESGGSIDTRDGYGTPVSEYIDRFGNYDTPFMDAAPPAPPPGAEGQILWAAFPGATLTGGPGADTLNASQGADHLTGGGGADVFTFKAMPWSAGKITDFQVGVDKLNLGGLYTNGYGGADPVGDGYVRFVSDGAGGTKVIMDVDGPSGPSAIPFHVVTLQGVTPGALTSANILGASASSPSDPPPPVTTPAPGLVLKSPYPGATLVGGAGADTLIASQGADQLQGGAGADRFTFTALPWRAGHIRDFQDGVDKLDLRALFSAAGYKGVDPIADGYLRLVADGAGGTTVSFDPDGWGGAHPWPTTITTIDGIAPSQLSNSDWLFN